MLRAETINSGDLRFNCMRAANPSFAVETSYPAETNSSSRLSRMLGSSSTTKIGCFEGLDIVPLSSRGQGFSPHQINISFGPAGALVKIGHYRSRYSWLDGKSGTVRGLPHDSSYQLLTSEGVPSERPATQGTAFGNMERGGGRNFGCPL